jgi:CHAT domain-containing protein
VSKTVIWVALLVLLVVVALVHLRRTSDANELTHIVRLVEAVGPNRTVTARLVGGFEFGAIRTEARGGPATNNLKLLAEAGELQAAALANPSGSQVHAWGLAQLLLGQADSAVTTLENLTEDRLTPVLLANLGASYAARAATLSDPSDWYRSLTYTERALRGSPRLAEALFNKALALDALQLKGEAAVAWRRYLERDPSSPWTVEARDRQARLEAQPDRVDESAPASLEADLLGASAVGSTERLDELIGADPENTRKLIEDAFLRRLISGQVEPSVVARIADRFSILTADPWAHDLYSVMASESRAGAAAASFLEIAAASAQSRFDDLRLRVQAAPPEVVSFRPIELWIRYYRLQGQAERGYSARLESDLEALEHEAAANGYLFLVGTAANRTGQIVGRQGRQQDAIAARMRAVAAFAKTRSPDQVATMEVLIAESFKLLGDLERAFQHHERSLLLSDGFRTFRTRHQVLVQAGLTATAAGLHEAAAAFFSEARRNATRWASLPAAAVITRVRLASALELSGQRESARLLTDEAARLLEGVPDPAFRQRTELELLEVRAGLLPAPQGLDEIDIAIERFHALGSTVRLPQLYLVKARRLRELSQPAEALSAIEAGLAQVTLSRRSVSDLALRHSQAEMFVDLQTEAAQIFLNGGDHRSALARLDSVKAMSLEDSSSGGEPAAASPSSSPSIQEVLAPTSAVLVLADVGGRTDGWFVTAKSLRHLPGVVSTANLRSSVRRLREALASGDGERASSVGAFLGRRILDPIGDELSHLTDLVIVPSTEAAGLPFAALRIDGDRRYLVEAVALSLSPSLELVRRSSPLPVFATGTRRVLIAVAEEGRDELPPLPHAGEEAGSVAALYTHATVLTGAAGAAASFRQSYRDADIFHFVGHAVLMPGRGPTLVLGPDAQTDLTADRIRELGPGRLRTVVLAACSSIFRDGDSRTVDGMLSTARPFLDIGVPEVVGMLWDVEDDDAARVSLELHRELAAGHEASIAVATVQRRAIVANQPPAEWAALQVLSAPNNPNRVGVSP